MRSASFCTHLNICIFLSGSDFQNPKEQKTVSAISATTACIDLTGVGPQILNEPFDINTAHTYIHAVCAPSQRTHVETLISHTYLCMSLVDETP